MCSFLCSIAGVFSSSFCSPKFPTVLFLGSRHRSSSTTLNLSFLVLALRSRARAYLSELCRAMCSEKLHLSFFSSFSAELLVAATNLSRPLPLVQIKLPIPYKSTFLALTWIFFYTFSTFPGLCIPFLSSEKHLQLFSSIKWENLLTLLLFSGLSLSPPTSQSVLNVSFYRVYYSLWNPTPFVLPSRPVSVLYCLLSIKFKFFVSPF